MHGNVPEIDNQKKKCLTEQYTFFNVMTYLVAIASVIQGKMQTHIYQKGID